MSKPRTCRENGSPCSLLGAGMRREEKENIVDTAEAGGLMLMLMLMLMVGTVDES